MEEHIRVAKQIASIIMPLSQSTTEQLAGILVRKGLGKGDLYLRKGQVSEYIGYVDKGMIRQFYYKNHKDITEHFAPNGDMFFCIESFLQQKPTCLMAEALEPSVIYGIPYSGLEELISQNREIESLYRKMLEGSLIVSQQKADSWKFETAHERYNRLQREQPEVIKRAPLSHIASYLLMTPESLSRIRAGLL
jgi:CRP-like cAMP-binding protein